MPTARVQPATMGREVNVFVNKGTTSTPNWVMVGCATSKDYGGTANTITLNCDSGKIKMSDGEDPEYDLQLTGFVFQYATADQATNVSALEFETWFGTVPQVPMQYRLAGKYTDDVVRTFTATIASFRETGSNGEARTYAVSLQITAKPALTKQL